MAEYTIEITTYCPHNCDYCSTNAGPEGTHLSLNAVRQFLETRSIAGTDRINISGGEPLAHPRFWDILQLCKTLTADVWVYTNALEQIRYNATVIPEIRCDANVCLVPGRSAYIPVTADKVHLLQLVTHGRASGMRPAKVHVSGNIASHNCKECYHAVLQADGQIVNAPCKKRYQANEMPGVE